MPPHCTQHKASQVWPLPSLFQYFCCIYTGLVCMCVFSNGTLFCCPTHKMVATLSPLPCLSTYLPYLLYSMKNIRSLWNGTRPPLFFLFVWGWPSHLSCSDVRVIKHKHRNTLLYGDAMMLTPPYTLPYWPISCSAPQQWTHSVFSQTAREESSPCQSSPPGQTWQPLGRQGESTTVQGPP